MGRRASTIDKLPAEIREMIGRLRQADTPINDILAKLRELEVDISRSALGRHTQKIDAIGERMRRSRDMATALVDRLGDNPDNRLQRMNIELLHGIFFDLVTAAATASEEENASEGQVVLGPKDVKLLAETLRNLSTADKTNADRILKIEQETRKHAAVAAVKAAKAGGLSAETVKAIEHAVLGVEG